MIISSHIRGGYQSAANYLKAQGENETIRTVEISDIDADDLDQAFHNMWAVAAKSKVEKPLHHISINPRKEEHLTDDQMLQIVERCEQKYGYKSGDHQRVIVEHVKGGRQHFHVIWSRVSLTTGTAIDPKHHWKKSMRVAREMERELNLKPTVSRHVKRTLRAIIHTGRRSKIFGRYQTLAEVNASIPQEPKAIVSTRSLKAMFPGVAWILTHRNSKRDENIPHSERLAFRRPEWEAAELLRWAWENGRADILLAHGISLPPDYEF